MKILKKLTTLVLGAALLCTLVMVPGIKAHADGPVTWYITYSGGAWFASNNTIDYWSSGLDLVSSGMKDGDHIVFNADNNVTDLVSISVDKKIGDLVATNGAYASVTAPYAEKVYVAGTGTLIANVGTANLVDVWPGQIIQVIGNANKVKAHYNSNEPYPVFSVTGTVNEANVNYDGTIWSADRTIYGIPAGVFNSDEYGRVRLNADQYSTTPGSAPAAGTTTAPAATNPGNKQLDKVPQTGTFASPETIWFFIFAAVFGVTAITTGIVVKKRA